MNVLELYSGVGGMHMALNESGIDAKVVAAADINPNANTVYSHNFPNTQLFNRNIQSFTAAFINKLQIDVILMSPPCQPFTRNGLKGDTSDARTCSFTHLLSILPELNVKYILIENVKGFETSKMHNQLIEALKESGFNYQEFILSPSQIGVPNTRHRYYCLARRHQPFNFQTGLLMECLPGNHRTEPFKIAEILEDLKSNDYLIPNDVLLKRAKILDICNPQSNRSCCFTKAYGRYVEGTGSVYTPHTQRNVEETFKKIDGLQPEEYLQEINKLELRFFTPKEVAKLMSFPDCFTFPESLTTIQKYRLLGNSINVKLVSVLIKLLLET